MTNAFRASLKSITRGVGAALAILVATTLAACASGPTPGPTAIPLRPTETANFEVADIEALMAQIRQAGAPAVFVEIRDGEQVWNGVKGVRSKKSELPATITDPSRIASLTKPMVATILLQLVEEGRVQLDDPIESHLPGIVSGRDVTVRQLLNHSSGMPDYVPALALEDPSEITAQITAAVAHEDLVALSNTRDWSFEPGTGFEYSNTNYIVIAMLIESLTGNSVAQELQTRIAEPLGLANTTLPTGTAMPEGSAHGYVIEGALAIDVTEQDASLWSGAGGIVSTVSDVNTFMRALLTGQLLAPELLGEMLQLLPEGYGLGVQSRTDRCPASDPAYLESSANRAGLPDAPGASEPPDAVDQLAPLAPTPTATPTGPTVAPTPTQTPAGATPTAPPTLPATTPSGDLILADEGSGSLHESAFGELVQIGAPGHVYGHIGSGLGYRGITMSSPDGMRQVTILWTASPTDYAEDPRLTLAYELSDLALSLNC